MILLKGVGKKFYSEEAKRVVEKQIAFLKKFFE